MSAVSLPKCGFNNLSTLVIVQGRENQPVTVLLNYRHSVEDLINLFTQRQVQFLPQMLIR